MNIFNTVVNYCLTGFAVLILAVLFIGAWMDKHVVDGREDEDGFHILPIDKR